MNETELIDAIIRHSLELQRLSAFEEKRAEAILRDLETELRQLLNSTTLSQANRREIEAVIRQAKDAISGKFTNISGILDVEGIVQHVAEQTVQAMQSAFPTMTFGPPSVETIKSLSRDILIDGAPSSAWWAKQADDTAFKFAGAVRRGVLNGETNEQIVRKVVGNNGLIGLARRNARALVHSSIMTAANRARLETFKKNMRFAAGVRIIETLDSHTCRVCVAYDGAEWDFDGKPLNDIARKLDFRLPTYHWSCRGVISPVPSRKALDEVFPALADKIEGARDRATAQGPQKVTMTEWLKRNPVAAEEILGKKRVEMFLRDDLTLTDLVTKGGREKTLEELRQ